MRPVTFVLLLLLLAATPLFAQQLKTGNQYVTAIVEPLTGLISIHTGAGTNADPVLSYPQKSFLYVMVGDRIFTNNNVGVNISSDPRYGGFLSDGVNQKIADTIRTTWSNKNGCDVIQEVYPVRLDASGQIVTRWKIKNNSNVPVWGQAQFLLDIAIGSQNPNDGAPVLTRYGYRPIWEQYTAASSYGIPWLFACFEKRLPNSPSFAPGVSGVGYTDDVNYKLGLKRPARMTIGDWGAPLGNALVDNLWGVSSAVPWGTEYTDAAMLLEWDGAGVLTGTTTEIARTSYGTGEYGICTGQLFGIVFYPRHFHWNTDKYRPDTGAIDFYAFDVYSPLPQDPNYGPPSTNTFLKLHVGPNLRITEPDTANVGQKEQRQLMGPAAGYIPQYGVGTAFWQIVADKPDSCKGTIGSWLKFNAESSLSGTGPIFYDSGPLDTCEHPVVIDCAQDDVEPPVIDNLLASTSFPYQKTFDIHDDRIKDEGLDTITWIAQPGSGTDVSKFTIEIPSYSHCSKTTYTVKVTQLDSTVAGCFDFTIADCAGNDEVFPVCLFAKSVGIPDTIPPVIRTTWSYPGLDTTPCRNWCDSIVITDSQRYDQGLATITISGSSNMQFIPSGAPTGLKILRALICVVDTTLDGSLSLRATDLAGNYRDTTYCYVASAADVAEAAVGSSIEIFGNPAVQQPVLRITLPMSQVVKVTLLDIVGRVIRKQSLGTLPSGVTNVPISTSELAPGTYYVIAEWSGRQYAKKLSVVK